MSIEKAEFSLANRDFAGARKFLRSLLLKNKINKNAMYLLSIAEAELGNVGEALDILSRIIVIDARHAAAHYTKANLLVSLNRHLDALSHHDQAVELLASNPWSFINRGISRAALKNFAGAIDDFDKAVALEPTLSAAFGNKGNALFEMELFEQSLQSLDKAIELDPFNVDALSGKSACLSKLKQSEEALVFSARAIELKPDYAEAWSNRGNAFRDLRRHEEALASYERALELKPDSAEAWSNRGVALRDLRRHEEALASCDQAIALKPDYAEAWSNRGVALGDLRRHEEALASYERSIELKPDYAEAWSNRGNALNDLRHHEEALASCERAIELKPDFAEAWSNRGNTLSKLKRHEDAALSYFKADSLKKQKSFDLGRAHHQMMLSCNWTNYALYTERINEGIEKGELVGEPFGYQGIAESELLLKMCAETYCNREFPAKQSAFFLNRSRKSRIKIGYLCGEFRNQATSHLMTGIWEHHDSSKFELFGLDSGWEDDSDYRKRIKIAFPNFSDISRLSDFEAARLISENGIDILVNLNGYFGKERQGVFALKPAPISINYLGFPGTIGASYIDYLIADEIVIPKESIGFYTEKIIYLPFCYQANDDRRIISSRAFTRADFGLLENDFIFCCFNNNYKITPQIFAAWMTILRTVSESKLWLLEDNNAARENLIAEAVKHDINPNRLIFASRLTAPEHLGRQKLADLFLDTLPYNAHTTASDALWGGLPLLTLKGTTFPGRVGASLLSAIGLLEMVTYSYEEYANAAIELANNPEKLSSLKARLAENRATCPLFNTALFTQHIESAYQAAYDRYHEGLAPDHIYVSA